MNNMGFITQSEIEEFAIAVLNKLSLAEWQMKWTSPPSFCNRGSKIIYISRKEISGYPWQAKEAVLHEVAHIFSVGDRFHGCEFYKCYTALLEEFMATNDWHLPWYDRGGVAVVD